jgi:hypothetical protein
MPFLFLGLLIVIIGGTLFVMAKRSHDHEGEHGALALIMGGVILLFFYGLFYRGLTLFN